jgi:hypothetical protein
MFESQLSIIENNLKSLWLRGDELLNINAFSVKTYVCIFIYI